MLSDGSAAVRGERIGERAERIGEIERRENRREGERETLTQQGSAL